MGSAPRSCAAVLLRGRPGAVLKVKIAQTRNERIVFIMLRWEGFFFKANVDTRAATEM